jgi:hypothetical protein
MGTLEGALVSNGLLIVVTAPSRWLEGQVRSRVRGGANGLHLE